MRRIKQETEDVLKADLLLSCEERTGRWLEYFNSIETDIALLLLKGARIEPGQVKEIIKKMQWLKYWVCPKYLFPQLETPCKGCGEQLIAIVKNRAEQECKGVITEYQLPPAKAGGLQL